MCIIARDIWEISFDVYSLNLTKFCSPQQKHLIEAAFPPVFPLGALEWPNQIVIKYTGWYNNFPNRLDTRINPYLNF